MKPPNEVRLETPRGVMAGLRGEDSNGPRVLCLHGWQDNAASFLPLSTRLPGLDLVAVDLPGHGHSDHRHPSANYYFMENLRDVDAALDELGWETCHLVGHSLGAGIAAVYAAAAPERVRSLVMLDALGPFSEPANKCVARVRKSLHSGRVNARRQRPYASIDEMIKARQAKSGLPDEPARLICERSAKRVDDHYEWTSDPALYWVSPILMTEEQALEYLAGITAPVLTLIATPFMSSISETLYKTRTTAIPNGRHELLTGNHDFHMNQVDKTAGMILPFILEQERDFEHRTLTQIRIRAAPDTAPPSTR